MKLTLSFVIRTGAVLSALLLLAAGCSKAPKGDEPAVAKPAKSAGASIEAAAADAPPPPPPGPAPIASSSDAPAGDAASGEAPPSLQQVREALTQWTFQHNNPPKDLNELVKEGYLKRLPAAPPGKRFAFDPRTMTVTLVD